MKTMIIKMMAKVVLDNLGDAVVWLLEKACESVQGSDKVQKALVIAEEVSNSASKVAGVMKDGKITDEEKAALISDVNATADKIKAML